MKPVGKYSKFRAVRLLKKDHERLPIIDFLLSNLYKAFLLIYDKKWQAALLTIYSNITVLEFFNEYVIYIRHGFMLVEILQIMGLDPEAKTVLEYVRDLVEETKNNKEAIFLYEKLGSIYQSEKDY